MAASIRPKNVIHVAILLCLLIQIVDMNFDFSCPSQSQWIPRAVKFCTTSGHYHCLLDKIREEWREICLHPVEYTSGRMAVYSGNLDAQICSSTRYMPFIFVSNMSDECLYQKSNCSEEGQIIYEDRSPTYDASCLCDFRKGYAFVITPKNKCYCVPSEEDCSCYKTICVDNNQILSSDYACMQRTQLLYGTQCHAAITQYPALVVKESNTNASQLSLQTGLQINREIHFTVTHVIVLVVAVIIMILVSVIVIAIDFKAKSIEAAVENTTDVRNELLKGEFKEKSSSAYTSASDVKTNTVNNTDVNELKDVKANTEGNISASEVFLVNLMDVKVECFLEGENLRKGYAKARTNEPRILDMCFVTIKNKIFIIFIDADNNCIIKRSITDDEPIYKKDFSDDCKVNRLAKINDELIAVIYKSNFDIIIYNVSDALQLYTTAKVRKENFKFPNYGIQGIAFLDDTCSESGKHIFTFILSNRSFLYKCELQHKEKESPVTIQPLFCKSDFQTARRFAVSKNENLIFIADEDEKKITTLTFNGTIYDSLKGHNRGLQNLRAIAITERKLYAATSAGISVYFFNDEDRYKFTDEKYIMVIEYKQHVEHTRGLCLEKRDKRIYIGISCVLRGKDFITVFSFEET